MSSAERAPSDEVHEEPLVWVVLDIDRTIINTTAWFHACATPGALVPVEAVDDFLRLNEEAHGGARSLDDRSFRTATLGLLRPFDVTWEADLEAAGYEATKESARVYEEPFAILGMLARRYGSRLRLRYLTAGYESFMRGVVRRAHDQMGVSGITYDVVGSVLQCVDGRLRLGTVCDRRRKVEVVAGMLAAGQRIDLLADDDVANTELFALVERSGGTALRVEHRHGQDASSSWVELLDDRRDVGRIADELVRDASVVGVDYELPGEDRPPFDVLARCVDGSGIPVMATGEYDAAVAALADGGLTSPSFWKAVDRLVHRAGDSVALRGRLFYPDLPPYVFPDGDTSVQKWHDQLTAALDVLWSCARAGVLARWPSLGLPERRLVLCAAEHFKNALTQALDVVCRGSLTRPGAAVENRLEELDDLVLRVHRFSWRLAFGLPVDGVPGTSLELATLRSWVEEHDDIPFKVRELDDARTIAASALSLLSSFGPDDWPVGVIDFASGGLDLGFALRCIAEIIRPHMPGIEIAHLFYSSKQIIRDPAAGSRPLDAERLLAHLPVHARTNVDAWLQSGRDVLLYDNNVATFATLACTKQLLAARSRGAVRAAVATVYYENLARFIAGEPCEELCAGWQDVLDYRPVAPYVTAFSTWGTSRKSELLHDRFAAVPVRVPDGCRDFLAVFKVCRVHNVVDLRSVLDAGANAIGIHAVSPERARYAASQARYEPLIDLDDDGPALPVPWHEVEGIRRMQASIPDDVRRVLVIEEALEIGEIEEIVDLYDLRREGLTVQLQCRVGRDALRRIKDRFSSVIVAVGLCQPDIGEAIGRLDRLLDPELDQILLDMSKHQPDLIRAGVEDVVADIDRLLSRTAPAISAGRVPILLADDSSGRVLRRRARFLVRSGVHVVGIDTQNSVEVPRDRQRFRMLSDATGSYQALVRKAPDLLAAWKR